jgi:hypothetical protein
MRNIDQSTPLQTLAQCQTHQPKPCIDAQAEQCMNYVLKELRSIFPAWRFAIKTQQELDGVKRQWTRSFIDNDLHDMRQVEFGIRKARLSGQDFFPSVGKFIQWCQPNAHDLGLPNAHEAFKQLGDYRFEEKRRQMIPIVQTAFHQIGVWDLSHLPASQLFPIFNAHYENLLSKIIKGEDITQLSPQILPHPKRRTITIEEQERNRIQGLATIEKLKAKYFRSVKPN